jgi:membrane protease subunit HflK
MNRGRRALVVSGAVPLSLALAWAATGVVVIQTDEVGVVRRFGAAGAETAPPGLRIGLPWPLDRVDRIKIGQTRTLNLGAAGPEAAPLASAPDPSGDDVLTGDLNLVSAQVMLQYRVSDPVAFLYASSGVEPALAAVVAASRAEALAGLSIDDVLTTGRAALADAIARSVQARADRMGLGVSIRAVRLGRVAPPVAVAPAFADAARARSDRRQAITAAETDRDRSRAEAAGLARELADRAEARRDRLVQIARAEAERFTRVLNEARGDLPATRARLYLEAVAALVPRFARTIVVAPGQPIDLGLVGDASDPAPPPNASR